MVQMKPILLVHEMDEAKGGLPLASIKAECPNELRGAVFTKCDYTINSQSIARASAEPAKDRDVITWMRVKDFQLLSLRMICSALLHQTPFYKSMPADASKGSEQVSRRPAGMRDFTRAVTRSAPPEPLQSP